LHDRCFVRHSKRRSTTLSVAIGRKKQGVLPQIDVDGRKTNYWFDFDLQKSTNLSSHNSQLDPIEKANTNAISTKPNQTKPNESIPKPISTMMKFFYILLVALVLASTNGVFADVSAEILENVSYIFCLFWEVGALFCLSSVFDRRTGKHALVCRIKE
jgi:hypothetical protein